MRDDGTGGYHPHESPLSMLVPLGLLGHWRGVCRLCVPRRFIDAETGRRSGTAARLQRASDARDARRAAVGEAVGDGGDADRLADRLSAYIRARRCPAQVREQFGAALPFRLQQMVFRRALRRPVRAPGLLAGPPVLEAGRHRHHRPLRPRWRRRGGQLGSRWPRRIQSGYVYTYALVMLLGPCRGCHLGDGARADERAAFPSSR